jgi:hypothetical protein
MSITIELHGGSALPAEKVSGGGYIVAPIGAVFLGAPAPSRQLTGHYVIIVTYLDGQRGLISQGEIATIRDQHGAEIPFGNPRFPGHPDYDPRNQPSLEEEAWQRIATPPKNKNFRPQIFDQEQLEDNGDDQHWPDWS